MLTKTEKKFSVIFLIIVLAEIICANTNSLTMLHYFTKPAILIALIVFYLSQCKNLEAKTKWLTFLALLFSLLGDILLMFDNKSENFFISGLIAFLTAHVMYILVFLKKKKLTKHTAIFVILLLIYALVMFYFLKNGLGDLLIPVIVYMAVILSMILTAFLRKESVPKISYYLVFVGALFFVISDSILALNKFYKPLPFEGISIMFTYALAQLFIVLGIKKQQS